MEYKKLCPYCNKEIPAESLQQGGLHVDCSQTEIDVWFVSMPDEPGSGFCEATLKQVMSYLEQMEPGESCLIQKKTMPAGQYYNLSEFAGF